MENKMTTTVDITKDLNGDIRHPANEGWEGTAEQVELIKRTICKDATDDELKLFLYTCRRSGLDPLARQAHAIKIWDSAQGRMVMSIQTSIDGYRLIADRTGKYAPGKKTEYEEKDGKIISATAYVKKFTCGEWQEASATAYFLEYCARKKDGTLKHMWIEKPHIMIAKCAEALALRRAFPTSFQGLYTVDEMDRANSGEPTETKMRNVTPAVEGKSEPKKELGDEMPEIKILQHGTAPKPAERSDPNSLAFVPTRIHQKSGVNKNGKNYTHFNIEAPDETVYGTFDDKIAAIAQKAIDKYCILEITIAQSGKFFNIKTAKLLESKEDTNLSPTRGLNYDGYGELIPDREPPYDDDFPHS